MSSPPSPRSDPVRQDAAEAEILARREQRVRLLLADAKALALIEASRHYELLHCASVREYGERILSLSAREAYETAALGKALGMFSGLEQMVLGGRTTPGSAAALAELSRHPEAIRPDDRWLDLAAQESAKSLRKLVDQRLREVQEKRPPRRISLDLSDQGFDDLERARSLASLTEQEPLGPSRTVEVALREYVKAKDPLETAPGTRRMKPTDDPLSPRSRTVPAEVNRGIWRRAGSKCRLRFCDHTLFLDRVHVNKRHADGGSRELDNLDLHCKRHHRMQERGEIRNLGTTDAPRFVDAQGESLDERWLARSRGAPRAPPVQSVAQRTDHPPDTGP